MTGDSDAFSVVFIIFASMIYIAKYSLKLGIFVLLFLSLIQPFGIDDLEEGRVLFIVGQSLLATVSTFLTTSISAILFRVKDMQVRSLSSFCKMTIAGSILNVVILSAVLISFNSWFHTGDLFLYWHDYDGSLTVRPWGIMSLYVSAVSFFVVIFLFFDYRNDRLKNELNEVRAINQLLEQRQQRLAEEEENSAETPLSHHGGAAAKTNDEVIIQGQGIGATLRLNPADIIYVESMSNYADICYIADNETKHTTLRITLKQIRATLEGVESIVQCHRAFLVNLDFVVSLSTRSQGYQLQLFGIEKQIPVSRANTEVIKGRLV